MKSEKFQILEDDYNGACGSVEQRVMRSNKVSYGAKCLYAYLASFVGDKDECFPSLATILEETGLSKNTFYKYIKELEELNLIQRTQRFGKSTVYKFIDYLKNFRAKKNKEENTVAQNLGSTVAQNLGTEHKQLNTNNNTIDNSIDYVDEQPDSDKYLNSNKFFSREQKEALFYLAGKNVEKAKELEKTIFATKKIAIKDKQVNFKELPIIDWIKKIKEYASHKKVINKSQYLFSALVNEFKEYLCPSTNNSYKPKNNKKVIVPEWEETPKKEIQEATEEEKANLLAQLAALRNKTSLA